MDSEAEAETRKENVASNDRVKAGQASRQPSEFVPEYRKDVRRRQLAATVRQSQCACQG